MSDCKTIHYRVREMGNVGSETEIDNIVEFS